MPDVTDEQLQGVNSWPEGTTGYAQEKHIISLLNSLCKEHGYGRIPQMAAAIEEIWRDPRKSEVYTEQRQIRLDQMAEIQKKLEVTNQDV